jgi:voltage-gated potassium channel
MTESKDTRKRKNSLKIKVHEIIFEADTPSGKLFDILLLISILGSILMVLLDSIPSFHTLYGHFFFITEVIITVLFTIEYFLRIFSVKKPFKYIFSFYGIVDLLSILPTYIFLIFGGAGYLMIIRALRLLRVFRILKLVRYVSAFQTLLDALKSSRHKIAVFFSVVLIFVIIFGSAMYLIEGNESGFTSIPRSIYWAIVTLTTVGYGDIAPVTPLGQALASFIMILGYAIIAVPTGIITVEMAKQHQQINLNTQLCHNCHKRGHEDDAKFCKFCGTSL